MSHNPLFQEKLAARVVLTSTVVAGLCAGTAIIAASINPEVSTAAKEILAVLLPLIGTWVGTVLAFYFGRDTYHAAAVETRLSMGQQLSKPATTIGIALHEFTGTSLKVADDAAALKVTIADLRTLFADLRSKGYFRVPVLTRDMVPLYVIHSEPLQGYVNTLFSTGSTAAELGNKTLADMLDDPVHGPRVKRSFTTVGTDATVADVKNKLAASAPAQDAFITQNGRADGAVIRWITNNDIQEAAKA
jgi:hypothetical protein